MDHEFITRKELAFRLGKSTRSLRRWNGILSVAILRGGTAGRAVLYDFPAVLEALRQRDSLSRADKPHVKTNAKLKHKTKQ